MCVQAGLGPAVAAVFLQPSEFGENLETSTLQNAVNDPQQPPEELIVQYVSEVQQPIYIIWSHGLPICALSTKTSLRFSECLLVLHICCQC